MTETLSQSELSDVLSTVTTNHITSVDMPVGNSLVFEVTLTDYEIRDLPITSPALRIEISFSGKLWVHAENNGQMEEIYSA